jgi:hypothetical protein
LSLPITHGWSFHSISWKLNTPPRYTKRGASLAIIDFGAPSTTVGERAWHHA